MVGIAISSATLTACSGPTENLVQDTGAGAPVRNVELDFEHQAAEPGTILAGVTNAGSARVVTSVATSAGAHAVLADGVGGGHGIRFPAYESAGTRAGAALVVRSETDPDVLSPGSYDFGFGADFALDGVSEGSAADNGNNLVQRGLTADAEQYKIQVDHGVPSCRIAGSDGTALVTSDATVVPERWYRVSCKRRVDRVVLTVLPWQGKGWGSAQITTVLARTGRLDFDRGGAPLSVGAKVSSRGKLISSASDQFNGVVDNVHFEVVR